jgi:hypothetical protein
LLPHPCSQPLLLTCFCSLRVWHWEFSSLLPCPFSGAGSAFYSHLCCWC